jgi:AraC-like DNA-binding protein
MRKAPTPPPARWSAIDLGRIGLPEIPLVGVHHQTFAVAGLDRHVHPGLMEICYLKSGARVYHVRRRDYPFRGHEVFVTYPDEPHGSGRHPHGKGVLYWMQVRLPRSSQPFLGLTPRAAKPLIASLRRLPRRHFRGSQRLGTLFEEIQCLYQESGEPLRRLQVAACVLDWLIEIVRCAHAETPRDLSPDIRAALALAEQHPEEHFPVPQLAAASGLSVSRFKAKFQAEVGIPPNEFLLRRKVEIARRRLAETDRSITSIAFELGFSSSQYFATVFKRLTHRQPREVRRDAVRREG